MDSIAWRGLRYEYRRTNTVQDGLVGVGFVFLYCEERVHMKNSIVLTKAQFDRWYSKPAEEDWWASLVKESEKPELVEAWAVLYPRGDKEIFFFENSANMEAHTRGGRVVKLREVPIDGKDGER